MKISTPRPVTHLLQQWEKQPALAWALSALWVLLLCWLAFIWNLGNIGLVDETEPLFAEAARQMRETGDWITPYFNGETRFDKPPLIYWLAAIAYSLIGVNEWAARLPSALAAVALVGLSFYTLRFFGFPSPGVVQPTSNQNDDETQAIAPLPHSQLWLSAWIGAAIMVLTPETIAWARIGVSDMLLTGCMGLALLAFFLGYAQPTKPSVQTRWYLAFYILMALAVLTKGPIGLVLPGLIIGVFLLYLGNGWEVLREMRLLQGVLIFLVMVLPWYVLVILANGKAYIDAFFGYHNVERFTSVVNNHSAPWYSYFLVVFLGFAPWSVYLPSAIARLRFWQRSHWQQQPRSAQLGLFALVWFTVIFGFFTIAVTKLPSYVLPLMPAAAILVALLWSDQMTRPRNSIGIQISGVVNVLFLLTLAGAMLYSPNWMGGDPAAPNLPQVVQQSKILIWGAVAWAIAATTALILLLRRQAHWLWSPNFLGFLAFLIVSVMPASFIMDAQRQLPLRQLAATVVQVRQPGEEFIMVGFKKPSLVFYTQNPVTFLWTPTKLVNHLNTLPPGESQPTSALVLGYPEKIVESGLQPNQYQTLKIAGAYQLIRVPTPVSVNGQPSS